MLYLEYKNIYWQKNHIFFLELLQLLKDFPSTYLRRLKANGRKRDLNDIPKYKHLRIWIEDVTNAYDADILNLKSRIYWVLNGLIESPRCLNDKCKRPLNNKQFDPLSFDQPIYCSRMCLSQSSINIEKVKKTKEKHANDDIGYWKKIEEKKKQTKINNGHDPNWTNQDKRKCTIAKMLIDNPNYYIDIDRKTKQTKIRNGHDTNWHNTKQMVATRRINNNGKWQSDESKSKQEQASLQKYGFKSPNSSPIVKQHKREGCLKKYGVDSYSKTMLYHEQMIAAESKRKEKEYQTKKKNKSFNSSKAEDRIYEFLKNKYGEENIERQFKSDLYPFACDFYIKNLDVYIECNLSWTHGGHFFNENDAHDLKLLNKWKAKQTQYYLNAIQTWTIRDVNKLKIAKANNIKYVVIWDEDYILLEQLIRDACQ